MAQDTMQKSICSRNLFISKNRNFTMNKIVLNIQYLKTCAKSKHCQRGHARNLKHY